MVNKFLFGWSVFCGKRNIDGNTEENDDDDEEEKKEEISTTGKKLMSQQTEKGVCTNFPSDNNDVIKTIS